MLIIDSLIGFYVLFQVFARGELNNSEEEIIDIETREVETKQFNDRLPAALQSN